MAIPPFEDRPGYPYRVLPDGAHPCDESEFRVRFADEFPASETRPRICTGFFRLRTEAAALGLAATQWVDGSFVEGRRDPGDVDVFSFVDSSLWDGLDPDVRQHAEAYLNADEATIPEYGTHSMTVPVLSPGHPRFALFESMRAWVRDWIGRTRARVGGSPATAYDKGFVTFPLGDPDEAPKVGTERGMQRW